MSLRWIGPVALAANDHGDPQFTWTSDPGAGGERDAQISGQLPWSQAQQLSELVDNPERRQTVGKASGVLEQLYFDDSLLAPFSGSYLLVSFGLQPQQVNSLSSLAPFSLKCVYLANRDIVVARSSRQLTNDFFLLGQSLIVDPFWNEDATGANALLVAVGGSVVAREYEDV